MTTFVDTIQTIEFIKNILTDEGAKILEVGCGDGRLAAELGRAGYRVTAIDIDPQAVERARRNDVSAEVADIVTFESEMKFDAILFTRSLHHVHQIDSAMNKVKLLLDEKGRIIVDDFALEQMDETSAEWFYEMRDLIGDLTGHPVPPGETPLARWKERHHHEPPLHTKAAMIRAIEAKFQNVSATPCPYLYRYFFESCENAPEGARAYQKLFDWEKKLIEKGKIKPVGLRIVAKKYFSYLK